LTETDKTDEDDKEKIKVTNSGMGNKLEWPQRYLFITEKNSKFNWNNDTNCQFIPLAIEPKHFMDHSINKDNMDHNNVALQGMI
jgi:hypothetical protein